MSNCHEEKHVPRGKWVFYAFVLIGGVLLFTEHRAHLLGILPYLFLFACPLMHLFMHHGHGSHHHEDNVSNTSKGVEK